MYSFMVVDGMLYRFNQVTGEAWVISPWHKWTKIEEGGTLEAQKTVAPKIGA